MITTLKLFRGDKERNPNEELNLQEIKNAYEKVRNKQDSQEKALKKEALKEELRVVWLLKRSLKWQALL